MTTHEIRYELAPQAVLEEHSLYASTLANGLSVLRCFSAERPVLGNKDIAEALGMTRPTVSRLTFTLMGLGYLCRDQATGRYSLGPALLSLSYPLLAQLTVRQLAAHDMVELAGLAGGPVSIGMRDRLQAVYVETVQDEERSGARPDIGSTRPLLSTAMGRALLYGHTAKEREQLLERLSEEFPTDWERHAPAVYRAFDQIEATGFCTSFGEWRSDLLGVAVPLRLRSGNNALAISLTVPAYKADKKHITETLAPKLRELVRKLESRFGLT